MRRTLIAVAVGLAGVLLVGHDTGGNVAAEVDLTMPGFTPETPPAKGLDPALREQMIRDWSEEMGTTVDVGRQAFAASGPILDFQTKSSGDPGFGGVWTSMDKDVFKVHVRLTTSTTDLSLATLQNQLRTVGVDASIETEVGGPSFGELVAGVEQLFEARSPIAFDMSVRDGVIEVWQDPALGPVDARAVTSELEGAIEDNYVRFVDPPEIPDVGDGFDSGGDLLISSAGDCTIGYLWRSASQKGFVTAAHCSDNSASTKPSGPTTASGVQYESCPPNGEDFQIDTFNNNPTLGSWSYLKDDSTPPWPTFPFGIAGGFYETQPSYKVGLSTNSTRGNSGIVEGYRSSTYKTGDCPRGTINGVGYTNISDGGDSGGPVYVYYNTTWYLMAIHNSSPAGTDPEVGKGTFIGATSDNLPSGAFICTAAQNC